MSSFSLQNIALIARVSNESTRRTAGKWLAVVFAVFVISFCIPPIANQLRGGKTKDYALWFETGQRMLRGGDIYQRDEEGQFSFMYPPSAAAMLALPATMGKLPMIIVLVLVTSACWFACIVLSVYLASGSFNLRSPLLYWVPSLCCIFYVFDIYLLGQPAIVLLACMLGTIFFLRRKIYWAAGALLAIASAIKAFPILAVGYLIYRRQWRATSFTILFTTFLVLVLPATFRGFNRASDDFRTWTKNMVFKYDATTIAERRDRGFSWRNNSLQSVANRLLRPVPADHLPNGKTLFVNVATLPFKWINVVIVGSALGLGLAYILLTSTVPRTARNDAIEFAMMLLLLLIFAPLSFNYNWCWMIFPITLVLNFMLSESTTARDRKLAGIGLIICLMLLMLTLPIPWFHIVRAYGNNFWAALVMFGLLGWIMRRREKIVEVGTV
jgi:hypothetical protein